MSTELTKRLSLGNSVETKASAYDKINAILIAALLLFGFLFATLFLIWITTAFDFSRVTTGVTPVQNDPGDEKPKGEADDVLEPGVEEFPEVETPQLANALEAVTDAVSSVRASLEKRSGEAAQMGRGSGYGSRDGGDGSGGDGVPEYKRWKIAYEASDINVYSDQLRSLNIDIGVVHQTKPDIWRLHNPGAGSDVKRTSRESENKSLYFTHAKERLRRWDQQLCRRANMDLSNTIQCQFYPESTRVMLRKVEADALVGTGKNLVDVRNTFFKVVPGNGGFVFEHVEFKFR